MHPLYVLFFLSLLIVLAVILTVKFLPKKKSPPVDVKLEVVHEEPQYPLVIDSPWLPGYPYPMFYDGYYGYSGIPSHYHGGSGRYPHHPRHDGPHPRHGGPHPRHGGPHPRR